MNDEAVSRTAPATLSLLKSGKDFKKHCELRNTCKTNLKMLAPS